jgi:hypothetical protein
MPALPAVPTVLKVACIFADDSNTDIVSRFYIKYGGSTPNATDLNAFCTNVKDAAVATIMHAVNQAYVLGRVHAIDLSSTSGAEGDWLGAAAGDLTGDPLPSDVAQVCSYEISRHYRGGHPRGYWPMNQAGDLDSPQFWSAGVVAGNQGQFADFFASVLSSAWSGGGPLSHVNVSYYHGFTVVTSPTTGRARNVPTVRATPLVDTVGSYVARRHIGTQRRRLQY